MTAEYGCGFPATLVANLEVAIQSRIAYKTQQRLRPLRFAAYSPRSAFASH